MIYIYNLHMRLKRIILLGVVQLDVANKRRADAVVVDLHDGEWPPEAANVMSDSLPAERDDDGGRHIPRGLIIGIGKRCLDVVPHASGHGT